VLRSAVFVFLLFGAAATALVIGPVLTASAQAPAGSPPTAQPVVAFFAPEMMHAELRYALEDALATQLSLLRTSLHYETSATPPTDPVERLQIAKQTASRLSALAVFWLELPVSGPWLLYAVDARAERMIMRPLAAHSQSPEADVEAVALIVRATTDALLHGEPLPATNPNVAPAASKQPTPWPVQQLPQGESALRISGAYVGSTFAKRLPWEHGFALRAAWIWPSGTYLGVGFTFIPALRFDIAPVRFNLERYPISLHAGLRFAFPPFTFSGELGAELELRNRRTLGATDTYVPDPDQLKVIYNVCPKLEAEYAVTSWLVLFMGAGIDVVVGNFAYTIRNMETQESTFILEPHWIRLTLHVGVGIIR
jgi:hypothetical protein